MESQVLVLDHRRIIFVALMSLLLSVFLIPAQFASAETNSPSSYATANTNQTSKSVSTEIDKLKALIAQLQARITEMQKTTKNADNYVERTSTTKKPVDVATTTLPKKDKPNAQEYSIITISNNKLPLVNGKSSNSTTTTIIIENSTGDVVYTKENIKVTKGNWYHKVTTELTAGTYTAILEVNDIEVAKKEFKVGQTTKPDTVPDTQPTSTATTGEYRGYYSDGHNFIITKIISKADALVNCLKNAALNPTKKVYCTWKGEGIYGTKPALLGTMPTKPATTTTTTNVTNTYSQGTYGTQSRYPTSYTSPTRYGDVRGATTTNPKELLATILIGFMEIFEALE